MIILFFISLYPGSGKRDHSIVLIKSVIYTNSILIFIYLTAYFFRIPDHFKTGGNVFSGWLVNHNHFAMLIGTLMPYAIAMSVYKRQKRRSRIMWFFSLFVLLTAFLFSVSRGGYISFAAAISITLISSAWLGIYKKKTAFVLFAAAVAMGIFIMNLYPFEHRLFSNLFILSASQRLGIWYGSIKMFISHPFIGWGLSTYGDAFHSFRPSDILYFVNHAHNIFIEIADDTGILGLVLFLWIIAAWLSVIIKGIKHASSDLKKAILWAGFTSTLYLIFHNFVDFGIFVPSNAVSVIILMAGTASVLQINSRNLPLDYFKKLSSSQRILTGIAAGILFIAVIAVSSRAIYGEYMYKKGKGLLDHNDSASAVQTLRTAQKFIRTDAVYSASGQAWFEIFIQSGKTKALDFSIRQFKEAGRLSPWNPYYPEDIGGLYQYKGDVKQAALYTQKALSLDPSNASLCLRMADLKLEDGHVDSAILFYKKASLIYPPYSVDAISKLIFYNINEDRIKQFASGIPDGKWVLAKELAKLGRKNEAIVILKRLVLSDPRHASRYIKMFISLIPDKEAALQQLRSLAVPDNTDVLFYTAALESQTGKKDSAVKILRHIIGMNNTRKDAYQLLADIYASEDKIESAIRILKEAVYYIPSDYTFYAMLGRLYNRYNDWYNAIEAYKMTALLNPKYEQSYIQMALIYKQQDMPSKAVDIIRRGIDKIPGSVKLKQMLNEARQVRRK